jgi:hypothetical protein
MELTARSIKFRSGILINENSENFPRIAQGKVCSARIAAGNSFFPPAIAD